MALQCYLYGLYLAIFFQKFIRPCHKLLKLHNQRCIAPNCDADSERRVDLLKPRLLPQKLTWFKKIYRTDTPKWVISPFSFSCSPFTNTERCVWEGISGKKNKNETATINITVISSGYNSAEIHGLPGNKEHTRADKPLPEDAGAVKDCVVQGTKTRWQTSLLLQTMWLTEKSRERENLNLCSDKISLFPQTTTKRQQGQNKEKPWFQKQSNATWAVCSTPLDRVAPLAAAVPLAMVAGTRAGQELAVLIPLLFWQAGTSWCQCCSSELAPHCKGKEAVLLGTENGRPYSQSWHGGCRQVFVEFAHRQFRIGKCNFLEMCTKQGAQRETKERFCIGLERQFS